MASAASFSLRQWSTGDKKPKTISEFIARMNSERGGFRNITEESLTKEAEEEENGVAEDPDTAMASGSEDEDAAQPTTVEDIRKARDEVMRAIEWAGASPCSTGDAGLT